MKKMIMILMLGIWVGSVATYYYYNSGGTEWRRMA